MSDEGITALAVGIVNLVLLIIAGIFLTLSIGLQLTVGIMALALYLKGKQ